MKKIIALLMATFMVLTMVACGSNADDVSSNSSTNTEITVGQKLLEDFTKDSSGTPQEIANRILGNEIIEFMSAATPVEEGLLNGFDNTEIKGFKDGVMFGPMMSSIAFVGYIFELEENADIDAFKQTLKDSANLRWNICVEAEELIVENSGNKVFFLMCPKSFEQPDSQDSLIEE